MDTVKSNIPRDYLTMPKATSANGIVPESVARFNRIEEIEQAKRNLNFKRIPMDDKKTWDMICSGFTKGIFQLEKQLGKRYCKEIAPRNIEQLSDVLSLIRPGCLEGDFREKPDKPGEFSSITNTYIKVKHCEWEPKYIHDVFEPIFKDTYSVPIYQEQIMRMCADFAGFTLKEADVMRKAVGKKKQDLMESLRQKFVNGAVTKGFDEGLANTVFKWIEDFSSYGFNKCTSGKTLLNRGMVNQHSNGLCEIGHLYKLVHNREYAQQCGQLPLRKKLQRCGYGNCMAMCSDGRVRPMPIKDIHYNGPNELFKITDNGGRTIECTINHKFMTPNGDMVPIGDIGVGGKVICHIDSYDDEYTYNYNMHNHVIRSSKENFVDSVGRKNGGFIDGNWQKFKQVKEKYSHIDYCQICEAKPDRLEWHHIDGDRTNNAEDNLIKLCVSCHKKEDYKLGRSKRFDKGHKTGIATIVSIEYVGVEDTYDVEMDTPDHNWIANDFVVSNSHGVSYALIAYKTAYAKTHYPLEFFKSMLANSDGKQDSLEEIQELVHEARYFGIEVKPPSLKNLNMDFEVKDGIITFGLAHIKGVGKTAETNLKKFAKYKNKNEWLLHATKSCPCGKKCVKLRSNVAQALIKSGAMDYLVSSRIKFLAEYNLLNIMTARERKWTLDYAISNDAEITNAYGALLESKIPNKRRRPKLIEDVCEMNRALAGNPRRMCIAYEKFYLGIPLSGSLVDLYHNDKVNIKCANFPKLKDGAGGAMGVVIEKIRQIKDKNNNRMAFLTISDDTYLLDSVVVFSSFYNKLSWILEEGRPVLITGKKNRGSFLVKTIEHL